MINPDTGGQYSGLEIAIVGMSGRFPGAQSIEQFWGNLRDGVESVSFFSDDEMLAAGVDPALIENPSFVKAAAVLDGVELFDANFFSYSPREAEIIDPQQRLFLECAWHALEDAGYNPEARKGAIGVYAGAGISSYLMHNLHSNRQLVASVGGFETIVGNDKDFLATRVSYKLGLGGPSVTVQSACSTSLVAVHMACQSLLSGECQMALAGGVSIRVPQKTGYVYREGGVFSPDGHCRAFDAGAQGMISGSGAGVVVLKRLEDALSDGDQIYAVIKGSAVNNDGSVKAGYTAPSIEGQAKVIRAAHLMAEAGAETIGYVEAHGTGTPIGDPIEVAALTQAFRASTDKTNFCAIGSVKTNIGHADTAAGVAGLIKATLSLYHKQIPPSLNFEKPNPRIDFETSPFFVTTRLTKWPAGDSLRRAGVSSFGLGGTNAHLVLEEAPPAPLAVASRAFQLLLLSTKTETALDAATLELGRFFRSHPETSLPDAAYTLMVGRANLRHRRFAVCSDTEDAARVLETLDPTRLASASQEVATRPVVFMFPGGGAQYVDMGKHLYQTENAFRETVDHCSRLLEPPLGGDLRRWLYPDAQTAEESARALLRTPVALPALFVVEYALARLLMSWGVHPEAMIGHSLGEYVAACLAGVVSLEDALQLVALRGRLFEKLPPGAMLSVPLSEKELEPLLGAKLWVAAVNNPALCVVSGLALAVDELQQRLTGLGIDSRRIRIEAAGHSAMVEPILNEFRQFVETLELRPPEIPYVSNVTGKWMAGEATDPSYWVEHLRRTVRFGEGLGNLLKGGEAALIEVGPSHTLTTLARQHPDRSNAQAVLPCMRHPQDKQLDGEFLLNTLGRLWLEGCSVDWKAFYAGEQRRREHLPTYPFERQRYWIEPRAGGHETARRKDAQLKNPDPSDWFYLPSWRRSAPAHLLGGAEPGGRGPWLAFVNSNQLSARLMERLLDSGIELITVAPGPNFKGANELAFTLDPREPESYEVLVRTLAERQTLPAKVLHLWAVSPGDGEPLSPYHELEAGYFSLLFLAKALGRYLPDQQIEILVVADGVNSVTGDEELIPLNATLLSLCTVISQEHPNIVCRLVDIVARDESPAHWQRLLEQLYAELLSNAGSAEVAYRGGHRWLRYFERVKSQADEGAPARLRPQGVYLLTGGLGEIGLTLSLHLARRLQSKLVLVSRSGLPPRIEWGELITRAGEQDAMIYRITQLREMEQAGAEVIVVRADISDAAQARAAVDEAITRFGRLDGVIHAAGLTGEASFRSVQEISKEECERQFAPKIGGVLALQEALEGKEVDFCMLISSLASILGGLGFCAYSAANAFMDAFAQQQSRKGASPWVSVNWESWVNRAKNVSLAGGGGSTASFALTPAEGIIAFERALALEGEPQIVMSSGDIQARIDEWARAVPGEDGSRDTAELVSPAHSRPNLRNAYVAPSGDVEDGIAGIWRELLGIDRIGAHDSFFELNGNSLLATRIIARVRAAFRVNVPLRAIFESPTIAALAKAVIDERGESELTVVDAGAGDSRDEPGARRTIARRDREDSLPLSFAQQRLWFLDKLEPGSAVYNLPVAVRLSGPIDVAALERSLAEVVRRHEALRTSFPVVDGRPAQIILPAGEIANVGLETLSVIDLSSLPEADRESEARRLCEVEAQRPFDLAAGPVFRSLLLRLGKQEHILAGTMHHIVSDGWSMEIFVSEVTLLYQAFASGKPSPLADLPIQFADFALWQRETLTDEVLEHQLAYWREQLGEDLPELKLTTDRARPATQTFRGARHTLTLRTGLVESLKEYSRGEGATLFMTLLAAFDAVLRHHTRQDDIVVGTHVAGRSLSEMEGLIGFFVNTLVLRADLSGNPSFRELLGRMREVALNAYAHQDVPFDRLVSELQPKRDSSRNPLFQVLFILLNAPPRTVEQPGLKLSVLDVFTNTAVVDCSVVITDTPDGLRVIFRYNADLFDASTLSRLARHYETALGAFLRDPELSLDGLSALLDESDSKEQLSKEKGLKEARLRKFGKLKRAHQSSS